MKKTPLPADSKSFTELAFREKRAWHERRRRMSFKKKVEALDQLWEGTQEFRRIRGEVNKMPQAKIQPK